MDDDPARDRISDRRDHDFLSPVMASDGRRLVNEMDFFANEKDSKDSIKYVKEGSADDKEVHRIQHDINTGLNLVTTNKIREKSVVNDGTSHRNIEDEHKLMVLRSDLDRLKVENQRLRGMLHAVNHNYNTLQLHFVTMAQRRQRQRDENTEPHEKMDGTLAEEKRNNNGVTLSRQFMDLGRAERDDDLSQSSSSEARLRDVPVSAQSIILESMPARDNNSCRDHMAAIGPDRSDNRKDTERTNKVPKFNSSRDVEQAQETMSMIRKTRVSVRAQSEAAMISDGCQWRKYGQKMAKGNPCPRAYYRCTMAPNCPVRKQVQRCAEDRKVLITTYEGNHNHPLPPAAMAMASTTSAAATMLLSGSIPSADGLINSDFLAKTILPCAPSLATLSASAPFPTVTLDLTQPPASNSHLQRELGQFHVSSFPNLPVSTMCSHALYNPSRFSGLLGSQVMDPLQLIQTTSVADYKGSTTASAASAVTADPSFTAALVAAITSIIGNVHQNSNGKNGTAGDNNT